MKETTVIVKTFEEVEVDPTLKNVLGRHTVEGATFTEEEVSTLKTMISNLNENGMMKVYELIEHKEVYVDPKFYPNAVKKIFHEDKPNEKITMDQFSEWIQKEHGDLVKYYLNHWEYKLEGMFDWGNEEHVELIFERLSRRAYFSVVNVETITNVLGVHLTKENAEDQMKSYNSYYPDEMEVRKVTIFGSEVKSLYKLLSLLNI